MATKKPSLFEQLSEFSQTIHTIYLSMKQHRIIDEYDLGKEVDIKEAEIVELKIRPLNTNQLIECDNILNAAVPPKLIEEIPKPGSAFGDETIKTQRGYDEEDPAYRDKLRPLQHKRNACIILHGCPDLMDSTAGDDLLAKADTILETFPYTIVQNIVKEIIGLTSKTSTDKEDFFTKGDSKNSQS